MDKEYFLSQYVDLKLPNKFTVSDENIIKLKEYVLLKTQGESVIFNSEDNIYSLVLSLYFLRNVSKNIILKKDGEYFLIFNSVLLDFEESEFIESKLFHLAEKFNFIENKKNKEININKLWEDSIGKNMFNKFNDYLDRLKRELPNSEEVYINSDISVEITLLTEYIILKKYKKIYFKTSSEKEYILISK